MNAVDRFQRATYNLAKLSKPANEREATAIPDHGEGRAMSSTRG
ncbi:MAG: hypothetical protein NTV73_11180 [Hyphomicrobiales bacterium]|nr:hypothetical protein [Hyphomicrobiales bacterium]